MWFSNFIGNPKVMSINKEELYLNCLEKVNAQINKYQGKLDEINEYNEENKMSPEYDEYGNKGEMLNEYEQNVEHLDRAREMKETLANIDHNHRSEVVRPGSVIETEDSYYYISVPLGEIQMDSGSKVFAISTEAPIYKNLKGLKEGDSFVYNGKESRIVGLY